jgi:hypothetical protein
MGTGERLTGSPSVDRTAPPRPPVLDAAPRRPERETLVRRLALAKLRELRRSGLSFREIGRRYGAPKGSSGTSGPGSFARRLSPERLLAAPAGEPNGAAERDAASFLRALDALGHPLAFFSCRGEALHLSRAMEDALGRGGEGEWLRRELEHFAASACSLVRLRGLGEGSEVIEGVSVQEVPGGPEPLRLSGSYVGVDLFGRGPSVLVALERPPADPLSEAALRAFASRPSRPASRAWWRWAAPTRRSRAHSASACTRSATMWSTCSASWASNPARRSLRRSCGPRRTDPNHLITGKHKNRPTRPCAETAEGVALSSGPLRRPLLPRCPPASPPKIRRSRSLARRARPAAEDRRRRG